LVNLRDKFECGGAAVTLKLIPKIMFLALLDPTMNLFYGDGHNRFSNTFSEHPSAIPNFFDLCLWLSRLGFGEVVEDWLSFQLVEL
jgi:hypothetical protein